MPLPESLEPTAAGRLVRAQDGFYDYTPSLDQTNGIEWHVAVLGIDPWRDKPAALDCIGYVSQRGRAVRHPDPAVTRQDGPRGP